MKLTPEFQKKIEQKVRRDIKDALTEVAKQITQEVREYISRELYLRPKSLYYDRDEDDGGFLGTFANARQVSELVGNILRTQGDKIYVTFLLRDYEDIDYSEGARGKFGHHIYFGGDETKNNRFSSELDNMMDRGWNIYNKKGEVIKFIQGIHFKEYAKELVAKKGNKLLSEYLAEMGYVMNANIGIGRKRISIPIDDIEIIYE